MVGALRVRMTDTEVRTQVVETKAAEGNASLYALEAELFKGLAQLSDRQDSTTAALGHQLGEHNNALLTAQEDAVALKAMIDTLAAGSGPAAAPAADPWWTGRNGQAQGPTGPGNGGGNGNPGGRRRPQRQRRLWP